MALLASIRSLAVVPSSTTAPSSMLPTMSECNLLFVLRIVCYSLRKVPVYVDVHLIFRVDPASMLIVASEHSLSQESGLEQKRFVINTTVHDRYDFLTYENDISLIFVRQLRINLLIFSIKSANICVIVGVPFRSERPFCSAYFFTSAHGRI